jgi:hypothetical protein
MQIDVEGVQGKAKWRGLVVYFSERACECLAPTRSSRWTTGFLSPQCVEEGKEGERCESDDKFVDWIGSRGSVFSGAK